MTSDRRFRNEEAWCPNTADGLVIWYLRIRAVGFEPRRASFGSLLDWRKITATRADGRPTRRAVNEGAVPIRSAENGVEHRRLLFLSCHGLARPWRCGQSMGSPRR